MGLFEFYQKAAEYVSPDPAALDQAAGKGERHALYHRWIIRIRVFFFLVGFGLGVGLLIHTVRTSASPWQVKESFSFPFVAGAVGLLGGATMACAFAPRSFLTGPVGKKWMKLIGTRSVLAARLVCMFLGAITVGPLCALTWMIVRHGF